MRERLSRILLPSALALSLSFPAISQVQQNPEPFDVDFVKSLQVIPQKKTSKLICQEIKMDQVADPKSLLYSRLHCLVILNETGF